MCGRFNIIDDPELQKLLHDLGIDLHLPTRANIAPTESVALVRRDSAGSVLADVRWWLTPHWARQIDQKYSMFNARSETLSTSRAFAEPFRKRRGIVPMSSFIEWRVEEGGKQPYLIAAEGEALAIAAVWDRWEGGDEPLDSCALVTTAAAPGFERLHQRMPLVLSGDERERWLDVSVEIEPGDPLFRPLLKSPMAATPISRGINNARNKQPELLIPTGTALRLVD